MATNRKKSGYRISTRRRKDRSFSEKSRQFLASLVAGKTVRVEWSKRDRYRRILGIVYVDGVNVNEAMVKEGLAWRYHSCKDKKLAARQAEAKQKRLS
jgi:endonuclease YncB( thermonuclease family)